MIYYTNKYRVTCTWHGSTIVVTVKADSIPHAQYEARKKVREEKGIEISSVLNVVQIG